MLNDEIEKLCNEKMQFHTEKEMIIKANPIGEIVNLNVSGVTDGF